MIRARGDFNISHDEVKASSPDAQANLPNGDDDQKPKVNLELGQYSITDG